MDFQARNQDGKPSWLCVRLCSLRNNSRNFDHNPFLSKRLTASYRGTFSRLCFYWCLPKLGAEGPPGRGFQFCQQSKREREKKKKNPQKLESIDFKD
jgi:hypothetical protein